MSVVETILTCVGDRTLERLRSTDKIWRSLRLETPPIPSVITESKESIGETDLDVLICGGTLGIFIGSALQKRGLRVGLVERGILRGRDQEWNISRAELTNFLDLELLTEEELHRSIATEYNPARVGFYGGYELFVRDVLNIGVDPVYLLETLKQKFLEAGGRLFENTGFSSAVVHPDGVVVNAGEISLKTRLVIDAMGHPSPIAQQARKGGKPDGVCLVVGSCGRGFPDNETGDLIYSFTPILNQCQYFWEAFPARDGRTTYLFTYVDTHPDRFSLEFFMEEYLRLLPEYQNVEIDRVQFERFLFGFFPAYRESPLKMPWDRILAIGDSSGSQSPVSFGGFGAMVRHLKRLTFAIEEALEVDSLDRSNLALLQPYQPNISVTWLFQKTMSVPMDATPNPNQINDLMSGVFQVMDKLGDEVLKPFLQDVVRFSSLSRTLPLVNPKLVLPMIPQVGVNPFLDWTRHYVNLALYGGLSPLGESLKPVLEKLPEKQRYIYHRWLDSWKYGSGGDYHVD
ncbi:FAD-binding oxidoreductase [Pannus brasiliensis CCIBt3594]|uniref:FAD-binding oxidoreductase n=1 Tax=Pannus brasiliensis CCIBt3594 TaxID=1427578 RepID=A0AAW9QKL9_9CHRO